MSLFPTTRMSILSPVSDFDRIFDTLLHNRNPAIAPMNNDNSSYGSFSPKANILESNNGYEIELAVPGFARSDFKIEVSNDTLMISADMSLHAEGGPTIKRREYDYSSFTRSWTLPEGVNANMIDATYNAGILSVVIPVEAKKSETLQIEVR